MSTIIAIAAMAALNLSQYVSNRRLKAKNKSQEAEIELLNEDNELCADEIERLNQHIIELMPVDESLYFEMTRSFGPNLTVIKGGKK